MRNILVDLKRSRFLFSIFCSVVLLVLACEPLVYDFEDEEKAQYYTANQVQSPLVNPQTIKVVTWNIRFGAGRISWFGDACGKRVILKEQEVKSNLQQVADKISEIQADLVLLQEVDIESKRSAYIDEVQWLLNHTQMNYAVYASAWHAQFIPSDGLGRMNMGSAILSRWPLKEGKRIALPLRQDQDALTQYFYLRRNILLARIEISNVPNLYIVNVHTAAFSTDDTKEKQIVRFGEKLNELDTSGVLFIAGGDLNTLPPGSDKTDYCLEDMCSGESFHEPGDDPFHKEGSNFAEEQEILSGLYAQYQTAVPFEDYQNQQSRYFTHSTNHPDGFWDRKLDYLFTNGSFELQSDSTHQEAVPCSDHAPVSVLWRVPQ